jgi:hypothetical protein
MQAEATGAVEVTLRRGDGGPDAGVTAQPDH